MNRFRITVFAAVICLIAVLNAAAETITTVTDQKDKLVQTLEAQWNKLVQTAIAGDIEAYKTTIPAGTFSVWESNLKAANRVPQEVLKAYGSTLASLNIKDRKFLRCDKNGPKARLAYSGLKDRENEFLVILFDDEGGTWKLNHYVLMEKPTLDEILNDPAASLALPPPIPTRPPAMDQLQVQTTVAPTPPPAPPAK